MDKIDHLRLVLSINPFLFWLIIVQLIKHLFFRKKISRCFDKDHQKNKIILQSLSP